MNNLRKLAKEYRLAGDLVMVKSILKILANKTGSETTRADLSYSFLMRELRQKYKDKVKDFQEAFKNAFDEAIEGNIENPEDVALMEAIEKIDYDPENV